MSRSQIKSRRRRNRLLIFGIVLAVMAVFALRSTVFAIDDPDTPPDIKSINAYTGVLDPNDLLIVVEYDLFYSVLPTETITEAYLGRFFVDSLEQNSVDPFAFNDKGYGRGLFSMYFTEAQKDAASIEFDNPNSEAYQVRFQGKVGVFPGDPPTTVATGIVWNDATDTTALLHNQIKLLARSLEFDVAWAANGFDLISSSGGVDLLTASGDEYFSNAIPHLQSMIPTIFSSGVAPGNFTEEVQGTSYADELGTFWDGNWIDEIFETEAARFQVPKSVLTSTFAFFWMALIVWFTAKLLDNTATAQQFGVLTTAVTLPMFAAVDWIPLELAIVTGFMCMLALMWTFIGRRAGA